MNQPADVEIGQGHGFKVVAGPDSRRERTNHLMFSAFDKATRKWNAPIKINDDQAATTHSFQGAVVGPDGVIHVAWIDRRHNPLISTSDGYPGGGDNSQGVEPHASLYYARSLDGGRSFENNQYVTGLVCACCQIVVSFSQGNVVLGYRSVEPGNIRDIFTTVSSDNGKPGTSRSWSRATTGFSTVALRLRESSRNCGGQSWFADRMDPPTSEASSIHLGRRD